MDFSVIMQYISYLLVAIGVMAFLAGAVITGLAMLAVQYIK